jgi:hypothetical protein
MGEIGVLLFDVYIAGFADENYLGMFIGWNCCYNSWRKISNAFRGFTWNLLQQTFPGQNYLYTYVHMKSLYFKKESY